MYSEEIIRTQSELNQLDDEIAQRNDEKEQIKNILKQMNPQLN
jgi:hypothetical protein